MDNSMLAKIKDMQALREEISRMSEELLQMLHEKIAGQTLDGVSVRRDSVLCAEVKLSAVRRGGNLAPETYIPEKQARAVFDVLLRNKQEPFKLCEDVRKMLDEKRVLDARHTPVYLNEETCRILRESELASQADEIVPTRHL